MSNTNRSLLKLIKQATLCSALALSSTFAHSQPPQLNEIQSTYKEVGSAKFRVLFWDIYQSRLASPSGKYDPDETFLFEITYLRDIKSKDLIERTIEQWEHIGLEESQYQGYLGQIQALWPDISKGDKLSMYVTNELTAFYYNDSFRGIVEDPNFAGDFVAIWLSENTSQPSLRRQLLGENNAE